MQLGASMVEKGGGRRRRREEHGANSECRNPCKGKPQLCALGAGVGAEGFASSLSLWLLPGSQIVRRRAGEGAQELSDVVSAVTPLNKAHLSGRQQIQQDFCRPDWEG